MSRRNWLVALLVALIAVVAVPTRSVMAQETRPGRVEGVVVNSADGKPVAGALVRLMGSRGFIIRRAMSDREGKFVFERLRPGFYALQAAKREVGMGTVRVEVKEGETTRARIALKKR